MRGDGQSTKYTRKRNTEYNFFKIFNRKGKPMAITGVGDKIRSFSLDVMFEKPVRFPYLSSRQLDNRIPELRGDI